MRTRRRGNNEGSVFRRKDGRWVARVTLPTGGRRDLYAQTRAEAAAKLTTALKAAQDGVPIPGDVQTLGAFLEAWIEGQRSVLRQSTVERYGTQLRLHAIPQLGRYKLSRLQPEHLQSLFARMLDAGFAPATVRHLALVLHKALGQAVRAGKASRNVAGLIDLPRKPRAEMKTLTIEESQRLLDTAHGRRNEALFVLAVTTGMRQGELLALRWRDVDTDRGVVSVRASVMRVNAGLSLAEPKTPRSRRQIVLGTRAVDALRRHKVAQNEHRLAVGCRWVDNDLVFPNGHGNIMARHVLVESFFEPLLSDAGLPRIRFHDLRHTAATIMLSRGIHPKIASEILGHASVAITLDTYSHVTPTMQTEAARIVDDALRS